MTIADLGVLRGVELVDGHVVVTITPTYSGCPAMETIRTDVETAVRDAGFADVAVETVLSPAWSTDWITQAGRRALSEAGIAPPHPVDRLAAGPMTISLGAGALAVACPQCGSCDTEQLSRFGSTACKSLWRCRSCREPFDQVKAL